MTPKPTKKTIKKTTAHRAKKNPAISPARAAEVIQKHVAKLNRLQADDAPPLLVPTEISAHINVGLGNSVHIAGTWPTMWPEPVHQWKNPVALECTEPALWRKTLELPPGSEGEFKFLLNGTVWETGENRSLKSGVPVEATPVFP